MNKIFITGRLTRDPEMVTLSNGMEKCRFCNQTLRRTEGGASLRSASLAFLSDT